MKLLVLQAGLYTLIGLLGPSIAMLSSDVRLTPRVIVLISLSCVVSGATALKAFLSTTFADSNSNPNSK